MEVWFRHGYCSVWTSGVLKDWSWGGRHSRLKQRACTFERLWVSGLKQDGFRLEQTLQVRSPALLPGPIITAIHLRELAALTPGQWAWRRLLVRVSSWGARTQKWLHPWRMLERLKEQGVAFPHTAVGAKSRQDLGISVNINSFITTLFWGLEMIQLHEEWCMISFLKLMKPTGAHCLGGNRIQTSL